MCELLHVTIKYNNLFALLRTKQTLTRSNITSHNQETIRGQRNRQALLWKRCKIAMKRDVFSVQASTGTVVKELTQPLSNPPPEEPNVPFSLVGLAKGLRHPQVTSSWDVTGRQTNPIQYFAPLCLLSFLWFIHLALQWFNIKSGKHIRFFFLHSN